MLWSIAFLLILDIDCAAGQAAEHRMLKASRAAALIYFYLIYMGFSQHLLRTHPLMVRVAYAGPAHRRYSFLMINALLLRYSSGFLSSPGGAPDQADFSLR